MAPAKESSNPKRVLLLTEEQGHGGVHTVLGLLRQGLIQHGWVVDTVNVRQSRPGWVHLLAQARQASVLVASNNFRPAYWAVLLGLLTRRPSVVWVHGPLAQVLQQQPVSWFKRQLLGWTCQKARLLVFASRTSQASLHQVFAAGSLPAQAVITNPAPPVIGDGMPSQTSGVALGFVGRLSSKRPHMLLQMMQHLPQDHHLTLVGDGPLLPELQELAAQLSLLGQYNEAGHCNQPPRVLFAGAQEVLPDTYRTWQATLLCSAYEGYPMAALESLSAGVPCIGTPLPALKELLGPLAPDWIAPVDTASSLAQTVLHALRAAPEWRHQQAMQLAMAHSPADFFRNGMFSYCVARASHPPGVKSVHFVHSGPAYMPELNAYEAHLRELGHMAVRHSDASTVPLEANIVWWICGRINRHHTHRLRYSLHVHEYASASVGRWPALKDRIKRWSTPKPDHRIFLNEWVRDRMGFGDGVPCSLRDMGVPTAFLQAGTGSCADHDLVYLGEMGRLRSFLPALRAISQAGLKLLLVGAMPDDLAIHLSRLEGITCTGRIDQKDVPTQLLRARAGLNLMPQRLPLSEQTSTKVLEYLAVGLPVLSNDYPWARRIATQFTDRIHLLPSTDSPNAWLQALQQLPAVQSERYTNPALQALTWHERLARLPVWSALGLTETVT